MEIRAVNLPYYISKRYLFAKKSHNAINLITGISVTVVAVGTMALIIVLSVFNGLEGLLNSMYGSYAPDLRITPTHGKYISMNDFPTKKLQEVEGLIYFSEIVEDMALLKYNSGTGNEDRQFVAKLKGVSTDYTKLSGIDTLLVDGGFYLENDDGDYFGVPGMGVYNRMNMRLSNMFSPIYAYYPNRTQKGAPSALNAMDAFKIESFYPSGVFNVQQDFNDQIVFVSIDFARKLMQLTDEATAIELRVDKNHIDECQEQIKELLGEGYYVRNQQEQNETLFKILKSEKWSSFLILSFILLIATFNIVGSITVLILEKKKDINSLRNMGAGNNMIKRIFFFEGMLISIIGSVFGLGIGALLILIQIQFGIIPMEGSFVIESFPVSMNLMDFLYVFLMVNLIGFGATLVPVSRISKQYLS